MNEIVKVTNLATRDSIFAVVGPRDEVSEYVRTHGHVEYLTFKTIHPNGGFTNCDVLNQPREIVMVGSEHEVELDEKGQVVSRRADDDRVGRATLG